MYGASKAGLMAYTRYLACELADYVTGADLAVHGGGEFPARYVAVQSSAARVRRQRFSTGW